MPRRKKTKRNIASKTPTAPKRRKDLRFSVSLVVLIAFLATASLLLLVSLIGQRKATAIGKYSSVSKISGNASGKATVLDDADLDFKLKIPAGLGDWIYKTGAVKSLVDDTLSDQYLKIYVSYPAAKNSQNFDDREKDVLTVVKFEADEWAKLEAGCEKNKPDYCDAMGTKFSESSDSGDGFVYAYRKADECPKSLAKKCDLADEIVKSFQLK